MGAVKAVVAGALASAAGLAGAHHSQQPFFHMEQNIELSGTVAKFDFVNPHPVIFLDVVDAAGVTAQWQVEGPTVNFLARTGWAADSLIPGDEIVVRGAPPKIADALILAGREVRKADGTVLKLYAEDPRRVLDLRQPQ